MREGVGTLRMRWTAAVPALAPGAHQLRFANGHHPEMGVYLANVLVPASSRIAVTGQDRDAAQRQFTVSYELEGRSTGAGGALLVLLGSLAAAAAIVRRSARPSRT